MADEDRLDDLLEQLDSDPNAIEKQFGTPSRFTEVNPPTPAPAPRRLSARQKRKVEPSHLRAYPNVYQCEDGEPVAWVAFFYNLEAADAWVARQEGEFCVELADEGSAHLEEERR